VLSWWLGAGRSSLVSVLSWWLGAGRSSLAINETLQVQLHVADQDKVWKIRVSGK